MVVMMVRHVSPLMITIHFFNAMRDINLPKRLVDKETH
jgi:hypothetical protein